MSDFLHRFFFRALWSFRALWLFLFLWPTLAYAQDLAEIEADQLRFDETDAKVYAQGNVRVDYQQQALFSDMLVWDQNKNSSTATGNIRFLHPNGSVVNAQHMIWKHDEDTINADDHVIFKIDETTTIHATDALFSDGFREATLNNLYAVFISNSWTRSPHAVMKNQTVTDISAPIYSACEPCKNQQRENQQHPPLWQVRATHMQHNRDTQIAKYKHARIEMAGIPVLYTPYLAHSTSDERASGFLYPHLGFKSDFGFTYEQAYYFNLAPQYDLTMTARLSEHQSPVAEAEWRHLLPQGDYKLKAIGHNPEGKLAHQDGHYDFRGGLLGEGHFWFGGWQTDMDIKAPTDNTVFYRYGYVDDVILTSTISAQRRYDRNMIEVEAQDYRYANNNLGAETVSYILPRLTHTYFISEDFIGGTLKMRNIALHSERRRGANISELRNSLDWEKQYITPYGVEVTLQNHIDVDLFRVQDDAISDEQFIANSASIDANYPLIRYGEHSQQFLSPQMKLTLASRNDDYTRIPYTNQSFSLTPTNLFDTHQPINEASRLAYGVDYEYRHNGGFKSGFQLGQIYNLSSRSFAQHTGYRDDASNYIGQIFMQYARFRWQQDMWFDRKTLALLQNETTTSFIHKRGGISLTHSYLDEIQSADFKRREYASIDSHIHLTTNWKMTGAYYRDLEEQRSARGELRLSYHDECTDFSLSYKRDFSTVASIEPSTTIGLYISLRTLGEFGTE